MTAPHLVVLDRDGTLNKKAPDGQYILRPNEVSMLPGAARAVARLTQRGVLVAVATNQRCVGLGLVDAASVDRIHDTIVAELAKEGGRVDAWFVCPHLERVCRCRKPQPGMLLAAMAHAQVGPDVSLMIGDSESDVEAASQAGMRAIRLGGHPDANAWATVPSLEDAVDVALSCPPDSHSPRIGGSQKHACS